MDPISDQFAFVSVYNYAENSPVRFIDLHGLQKTEPVSGISGPWSTEYANRELSDRERDQIRNRLGGQHETVIADLNKRYQIESLGAFADASAILFDVFGMAEAGGGLLDEAVKLGNQIKNGTRLGRASQSVSKILVEEADGFLRISDEAGNFAGRGWLDGGELNLLIDVRNTNLRGHQVFDEIFEHISRNWDEVTSIRGNWKAGSLDSNLNSYVANRASGLSKAESALNTFTGKMAQGKQFGRVTTVTEKIGANGKITGVDVIFKR